MTLQHKAMQIISVIVLAMVLCACSVSGQDNNNISKGATLNMMEYKIGRFAISIPAEMHVPENARSHTVRHADVKEAACNNDTFNKDAWSAYLTKLKAERLSPEGQAVIIKTATLEDATGNAVKGVFHYYSAADKSQGEWTVLIDAAKTCVWLTSNPTIIEKEHATNLVINNIKNIVKAYKVIDSGKVVRPAVDMFHLQHGAIDLPYKWQESTYIRFEGHPIDIVIEIEMDMDARRKIEKAGVIDKTTAAIVSKFAYGIDVDRIRSRKRTVAGMEGQEELDRVKSPGKKSLSFDWEFQGEKDNGYRPHILISMDSPDGHLEEKLKIWDAMLDSMKPMFERKK